jgi:hypothetical protein
MCEDNEVCCAHDMLVEHPWGMQMEDAVGMAG